MLLQRGWFEGLTVVEVGQGSGLTAPGFGAEGSENSSWPCDVEESDRGSREGSPVVVSRGSRGAAASTLFCDYVLSVLFGKI